MKTLSEPLDAGPDGGVAGPDGSVVLPVAAPLIPRETVSPSVVKLTFPAKTPATVGWKRTTTVWRAPAASENDPPEMIVNGAPTLVVPARVEPLVFWIVIARSTVAPVVTLPKLTPVEGATPRSECAMPLTSGEQALSLPDYGRAAAVTA
jgi:hypothetical protein